MLTFLRFLKGYLIIVFSGENAEKMLNICALNHLNIWGMVYKNKKIFLRIDIASFKRLKSCKKSVKCPIKILKKRGIPFFIKRYKKRLGIPVGIILFFVIIKLFSMFIWTISIEGNETIPKTDIYNSLNNLGIYEGVKADKIDSKNDAQKLIINDERIAWCSLNIEGCKLTVNISETSKIKGEKNMPSNLLAKCDGVIKYISVKGGNKSVNIGQTVYKGDVLVSGIIEKLYSTLFVRSIGEITAETEHTFIFKKPFKEKIDLPYGKIKNSKYLNVLGAEIPLYLGKINDITLLENKKKTYKITGNDLPISVYSIKFRNNKKQLVTRSKEKLIKLLNKESENKVKSENYIDYSLISSEIIENNNEITLIQKYKCTEIISIEEPIIINN